MSTTTIVNGKELCIHESTMVVVSNMMIYNKFQLQAVKMLDHGLQGLVCHTEDVDRLKQDIVRVLTCLDKQYPRKGYHLTFRQKMRDMSDTGAATKNLEYEISLADSRVTEQHFQERDVFAVVRFIPIQGVFVRSEADEPHMFAAPNWSDRLGWATVYNEILAKEGGEQ